MADRPIIMSADSVRAILAGRKTQSRRVLRLVGAESIEERPDDTAEPWPWSPQHDGWVACPYGAAGSRLWVRETWAGMDAFAFVGAHDVEPPQCVGYRADESALIWSDANRPPKPADTTGWNATGALVVAIEKAPPDDDPDPYTDRATVTGEIERVQFWRAWPPTAREIRERVERAMDDMRRVPDDVMRRVWEALGSP